MKNQFYFETKIGTYDAYDNSNTSVGVHLMTVKIGTAPWKTVLLDPSKRMTREILETYENENEAIQGHLKHCKDWMTK